LPLYSSVNDGTIDTGSGNDSIILQGGLYNSGGLFLGEGNDFFALTPSKFFPNYALTNSDVIDTGDGDDIITSTGVIYNEGVFSEGVINMGNGKDSLIHELELELPARRLTQSPESLKSSTIETDSPFIENKHEGLS
jgi:hypothetical protein